MISLGGFSRSWTKAVDRLEKETLEVVRNSYTELFLNIVYSTPVKTGNLRGNWQVGINNPKTSKIDRLDPSGSTVKSEIVSTLHNVKLGDQIFLNNNTDYAQRIEYGYSRQAPIGMVRVNVVQFQSIVNKYKRRGS